MGRSRFMGTISIENHGVLDTIAKGKKRQKIPTDQAALSFFNFEGEEVMKEVKVSPRRKNDSSGLFLLHKLTCYIETKETAGAKREANAFTKCRMNLLEKYIRFFTTNLFVVFVSTISLPRLICITRGFFLPFPIKLFVPFFFSPSILLGRRWLMTERENKSRNFTPSTSTRSNIKTNEKKF